MQVILVPMDGSDHALKALHIACDLADKYGGKISLLYIATTDKTLAEIIELPAIKSSDTDWIVKLRGASNRADQAIPDAVLRALGDHILENALERVTRRGIDGERLKVEEGDPAQAILIAAKQIGANTIVMGSRGVSNRQDVQFGSVSHEVFAKAECTCISVK